MADTFYELDESKADAAQLKDALRDWKSGTDKIIFELNKMAQMIDGDGSSITHFVTHVTRYGFEDTSDAKAAYDELASAVGKITTDGSVTNVQSARDQVIQRFGFRR